MASTSNGADIKHNFRMVEEITTFSFETEERPKKWSVTDMYMELQKYSMQSNNYLSQPRYLIAALFPVDWCHFMRKWGETQMTAYKLHQLMITILKNYVAAVAVDKKNAG